MYIHSSYCTSTHRRQPNGGSIRVPSCTVLVPYRQHANKERTSILRRKLAGRHLWLIVRETNSLRSSPLQLHAATACNREKNSFIGSRLTNKCGQPMTVILGLCAILLLTQALLYYTSNIQTTKRQIIRPTTLQSIKTL